MVWQAEFVYRCGCGRVLMSGIIVIYTGDMEFMRFLQTGLTVYSLATRQCRLGTNHSELQDFNLHNRHMPENIGYVDGAINMCDVASVVHWATRPKVGKSIFRYLLS